MDTIELSKIVYDNGYMPVPLIPGDKAIKCEGWTILAGTGQYDPLWLGAKKKSNIGNYAGNYCIIADFDAKGDKPSINVYNHLKVEMPEVFNGGIVELTPSGGVHATFKWTNDAITVLTTGKKGKTYARFTIDNITYDVEILTRGAQAVMPPSVTEKGSYKYLSEITHLNTKRDELTSLPEVFSKAQENYVMQEQNKTQYTIKKPRRLIAKNLDSNEITVAIDELIDIYLRNATEGHRHFQALGLAANIAGLPGISERDVERAVETFFNRSRQPNSSTEIDGIVKFGLQNASSDPAIPWKKITQARIKTDFQNVLKRRGLA